MNSLNWLHLTDLHFGLAEHPHLWPNVREAFFQDLSKLHELCGPWHVVFFTGDLVHAGRKEQFEQMENEVLGPLWNHLKDIGSKDAILLPVPGNHDLLRPFAKGQHPSAAVRQLLRVGEFSEIERQFWEDPDCEYRQVIRTAFANYVEWWGRAPYRPGLTITEGLLPGDFSTSLHLPPSATGVAPLKIGVVGLTDESVG
jgi:3',5'-cyclic AMP phosphodiesterase CpdA